MTSSAPVTPLADLRREIDRIDDAMHGLLIERSGIIERLIATKGTASSGAAFRPEREASMMRALAERHRGLLPLDTAEGIWRVIIATFTYVQAPFSVHVDASGGDAPMRDSARFHFGFTVPYVAHPGAGAVVEAVARSRGDLGLLRLDERAAANPWWRALEGTGRPKVIARLPFIERPDHPAGTPVLVVSPPLEGPGARQVLIYSSRFERWSEKVGRAVAELEGEILASAGDMQGLSVLLALPGDVSPESLAGALARTGVRPGALHEVGAHAERFRVSSRGASAKPPSTSLPSSS